MATFQDTWLFNYVCSTLYTRSITERTHDFDFTFIRVTKEMFKITALQG